MEHLTKEEMKEALRLIKPDNKKELEDLILACLKGPGHPVIEKLATEVLDRVRTNVEVLEDLKRQLEEREGLAQ